MPTVQVPHGRVRRLVVPTVSKVTVSKVNRRDAVPPRPSRRLPRGGARVLVRGGHVVRAPAALFVRRPPLIVVPSRGVARALSRAPPGRRGPEKVDHVGEAELLLGLELLL